MFQLISMAAGGIMGFIFRYAAEARKDRQERDLALLKMLKQAEESHDAAVKRVPIDVGKNIRQIIVLAVLFAAFIAPFINPYFGIQNVVAQTVTSPSWLFGIIPGMTKVIYTPISGYVMLEVTAAVLSAIVGFYFGNAAAGNKT